VNLHTRRTLIAELRVHYDVLVELSRWLRLMSMVMFRYTQAG
jgi:hypothetical protein